MWIKVLEEQIIGEPLPSDYKEFLLAYNGVKLLTIDGTDKPVLSYFSNIKEVDDFDLASDILEGATLERNSIALIGSNHDGSVKAFMSLKGKKKGEIYNFECARDDPSEAFKKPAYKSFADCLQSIAKSEYAKQVANSSLVTSVTKVNSPSMDQDVDYFKVAQPFQLPVNSKKYPTLQTIIKNLFEKSETGDNEYGRIVLKNWLDKRKILLVMAYVRDVIHEKSEMDIQYYLNHYSPFKLYLIAESDLEDLVKEGVMDENDELTKKGKEEAEAILQAESEKIPKREGIIRPIFKGYVDVILAGKTTPLQLTQIGPIISDTRLKKFEKDLGSVLPKEYKEFLLGYNGGLAKQSDFVLDGTETTGIKIYRNLQSLEERLANGALQNTEWLAIGTDINGRLIFVNLKGDKKGFIYKCEKSGTEDETNGITHVPKQFLAKSFLEYVSTVVEEEEEEGKDDGIDEEYLDLIIADEVKSKFPQLTDVMWHLYETIEKQESKYGRVTIPNKQDQQNVILLVKYMTTANSEAFVTILNHTPFKFFAILDTHVEELKKAKLLDKNAKLSKKGRDEVEKLLAETKIEPEVKEETKKSKKKEKDDKQPKPIPKSADKKESLKRKLEESDTTSRHVTRSSTKESVASANKKR